MLEMLYLTILRQLNYQKLSIMLSRTHLLQSFERLLKGGHELNTTKQLFVKSDRASQQISFEISQEGLFDQIHQCTLCQSSSGHKSNSILAVGVMPWCYLSRGLNVGSSLQPEPAFDRRKNVAWLTFMASRNGSETDGYFSH